MFTINKFTKQIAAGLYVSPSFFRALDAVRLRKSTREISTFLSEQLQKEQNPFAKAIELVQLDGRNLFDLPVHLQRSRDIVREAALQNPEILMRRDLLPLKSSWTCIHWFQFVTCSLNSDDFLPQNDMDIILAIMKEDEGNIKYAGLNLLRDKGTLLQILQDTCCEVDINRVDTNIYVPSEDKIHGVMDQIPHDREAIECLAECLYSQTFILLLAPMKSALLSKLQELLREFTVK